MNNQLENFQTPNKSTVHNRKYVLEERCAKLAEDIIDLVKSIPLNPVNGRVIEQVVGSGGSMGANYCEANEAESKRDFIHNIGICKKEIKETKHWLRLLARTDPEFVDEIRRLWKETQELLLIFSAITKSAKTRIEN